MKRLACSAIQFDLFLFQLNSWRATFLMLETSGSSTPHLRPIVYQGGRYQDGVKCFDNVSKKRCLILSGTDSIVVKVYEEWTQTSQYSLKFIVYFAKLFTKCCEFEHRSSRYIDWRRYICLATSARHIRYQRRQCRAGWPCRFERIEPLDHRNHPEK